MQNRKRSLRAAAVLTCLVLGATVQLSAAVATFRSLTGHSQRKSRVGGLKTAIGLSSCSAAEFFERHEFLSLRPHRKNGRQASQPYEPTDPSEPNEPN